jgi:hypothetical protein
MRSQSRTASVAALALLGACAGKDDQCAAIRTAIVTSYSQDPACPSPVGICTVGSVASGDLAGTTQFTALTMTPGPAPNLVLYTGELSITTASGTVTLRDLGMLDSATGRYLEMQHVTSATGAYEGHDGILVSQGVSTASGFQGDLDGSICIVN